MTKRVAVQVIHVYNIDIEAESEAEALEEAMELTSEEIKAKGDLKDITVDYHQVIDSDVDGDPVADKANFPEAPVDDLANR